MSALRNAYELIKDGERWTHGVFARNADGIKVNPEDPDAVAFCAGGALTRCGLSWIDTPLQDVARELFPEWKSYINVNDELGHGAIVQVFEKAIVQTEGSL